MSTGQKCALQRALYPTTPPWPPPQRARASTLCHSVPPPPPLRRPAFSSDGAAAGLMRGACRAVQHDGGWMHGVARVDFGQPVVESALPSPQQPFSLQHLTARALEKAGPAIQVAFNRPSDFKSVNFTHSPRTHAAALAGRGRCWMLRSVRGCGWVSAACRPLLSCRRARYFVPCARACMPAGSSLFTFSSSFHLHIALLQLCILGSGALST